MQKIGITGGIGSGKSVVCALLNIMGYPVFNADKEAKRICNESALLKTKLQDAFGRELYQNGQLNKALFAEILFKDKKQLSKATELIHPFVNDYFIQWAHKQSSDFVFVESAILFESSLLHYVDTTVTVSAPEDIRIRRVIKRDHVSELQVKERINNQLSEATRLQKANFILYNDGSQAIIPQVEKLISLL